METELKEQLTLLNDMSNSAASTRLRAARLAAGYKDQVAFAKAAGVGKTSLNNMEISKQFPNRNVMSFLYRNHGIDFNFLINGDYRHLSLDLQERLLAELSALSSELDRTLD